MTFDKIYQTRPDKKEVGSSGYSRLKNLFNLCKKIKPELIVESGTWKGNSSYLFRKACPDAKIYCFDINFSNLMWSDSSIQYIKKDIEIYCSENNNTDFKFIPQKHLVFFDDHINQQQRLQFCYKTGFKHLVFDDNLPANMVSKVKNPASPTLAMYIKLPWFIKVYDSLPFYGNDKFTFLTYVQL